VFVCACVCVMKQVPGVDLEEGDTIRRMSASDSATAVLSRRHHVFVCTDFTVRHIRWVPCLIPCTVGTGDHSGHGSC